MKKLTLLLALLSANVNAAQLISGQSLTSSAINSEINFYNSQRPTRTEHSPDRSVCGQ